MTSTDYVRRTPGHVEAPVKLQLKRYSTGSLGTPCDIHIGWTDRIWFTGTANAIGRLNSSRQVELFPRSRGMRPCFMTEGSYSDESMSRGIWFSDTQAGRVGFIDSNDAFMADVDLGAASAPRTFAASASRTLVTTNLGRLVELPTRKHRVVKQQAIDAVGLGPWQTLWYAAGNSLYCIDPYEGEFRCELPDARDIGELVGAGNSLLYCDEKRDIVGVITEGNQPAETRVIELDLPPGTGPRAVCGGPLDPWFTGRGGKSVFRIDHLRQLTEYRCSNATADLTRLKWAHKEMWFTEPRHSAISLANIVGL